MKTIKQDIPKDSLSKILAFANKKRKFSNSEASPSPSLSSDNLLELSKEVSNGSLTDLHGNFLSILLQPCFISRLNPYRPDFSFQKASGHEPTSLPHQGLIESSQTSELAPSLEKEQADLSLKTLFGILGYCGCENYQSNLKILAPKEEDKSFEDAPNDLSHNSNTQSICEVDVCQNCDQEMDEVPKPKITAEDSPLNIREEDEYLMDLHPHTNEFVTNPSTGRLVKKIVCMHPGCGKKFDKKWNFKDHIRMHMGDRPYKCAHCPKTFTQKGNLDKHMKQHEFKDLQSRKIHECHICHKRFTEKYNLKNHLKKHEKLGSNIRKKRKSKSRAKRNKRTKEIK
ncbi:unnamed protein product [Moneuplotes crassus]|uniref:C2H2-type domain-containing protein n=1 Tax=Euplotes crassus TaxID=5936 RepID=A0AAD2DA52_EUPCR|nr:unnamed protein product [Moneuplotes crassus]